MYNYAFEMHNYMPSEVSLTLAKRSHAFSSGSCVVTIVEDDSGLLLSLSPYFPVIPRLSGEQFLQNSHEIIQLEIRLIVWAFL